MSLSKLRQRLKQEHANIQENGKDWFTYQQTALYVLDVAKDAVDTFKPYKTYDHRMRDFLQIFYGIKNTVVGILALASGLLLTPFAIFYAIKNVFYPPIPRTLKERAGTFLQEILSIGQWFLGSTALTLRGITQVVTSPLALIRIPLRDQLSRGLKSQYFEDRKSIKHLVQETEKIINENNVNSVDNMTLVLDEIYRKKNNNISKNQPSYPSHWDNYARSSTWNITRNEHRSFFIYNHLNYKRSSNQLLTEEIRRIKDELECLRPPTR